MKKYSDNYFEKKYKILFEKLTKKEGFEDEIIKTRTELGIPEKGFANTPELAYFFANKLTKAEQRMLTFFAFATAYEYEKRMLITEESREEVVNAFVKKGYKDGIGLVPIVFELGKTIETHHGLFTKNPIFEKNKKLSKLYQAVIELMIKYWGVDLLDDHIIIHYIEKYLFMGQAGINQYIKNKVSCHNCRYLGINHFSPDRHHMQGQDKGPYSKGYIFNKEAVKMLSAHFNSVFLIIKPYATKELVLNYVEDNWEDLKEHIIEKNTFYKQFDVHPSIIRESDEERNQLVYELNKLSKKELLKRYQGQKDFTQRGVYKEKIISAILEEEYGIQLSSDAVKKAAARYAKSVKVQTMPKDIRDI